MTKPGAASFARRVYAAVRRIPRGRIATYGQIAAAVGHPRASRAVGTALARLPPHLLRTVPWHRVIASAGVSRQHSPEGALNQRELLRGEGIEVRSSGRVDVERYRWHGPRRRSPPPTAATGSVTKRRPGTRIRSTADQSKPGMM